MANGGQIGVENVDGKTQLHVVCKGTDGVEQRMSVDLASLTQQAAREHLEKQTEEAPIDNFSGMSDADMIKALAGCAAERTPVSSCTTHNMCEDESARSSCHGMTDDEIALALAGCVGSGHDDSDQVSVEAEKMFAVDDVAWYDSTTDHNEDYDMGNLILPMTGFEVE